MTNTIIRRALIGIIVLLVAGLIAWYFFLRSQATTITAQDAARGYGATAAPSQGAIRDAYNTIVSNISSFIGATSTAPASAGNPTSQLWHITKTPAAGMGFVGSGASQKLRFAERSTGNLFEADPKTGTVVRLTNRLFPKIYEAVFSRTGAVVLRSLDERGAITSFAGTATSAPSSGSDAQTLGGLYLERGIRAIVPDASGRGLVYLATDRSGGTIVTSSAWDGSSQKKLLSSPLSDWKLVSLADGRIFLVQDSADDVAGYAYEIKDGAPIPRAGGIPGLTFLPRTASSAYLFGESGNGTVSFSASTRADTASASLPIKTTADKCVWVPPQPGTGGAKSAAAASPLIAYCAVPQYIPSKRFLDDWYRGVVHTSDAWWRIDASSGDVELVPTQGAASDSFDVEDPVMDDSGGMIAFMNAADKTLWLMRINPLGIDTGTASTTPR